MAEIILLFVQMSSIVTGKSLCEGDPEELISCPFDEVHMLRRKRMPYHIIKCGKVTLLVNYNGVEICHVPGCHITYHINLILHYHFIRTLTRRILGSAPSIIDMS